MAKYYHYGARDTADGVKKIDLTWLNKEEYLTGYCYRNISWNRNGEPCGNINIKIDTGCDRPYVELDYKVRSNYDDKSEWRPMNYRFDLVPMPCNFGGKRWFFRCGLYRNGEYCGRKTRILYQVGDYFGCRKCADLSYDSCNKSTSLKKFPYRPFHYLLEADEYYEKNVRQEYYNGKPTKKYKRYLKLLTKSQGFKQWDMEKYL